MRRPADTHEVFLNLGDFYFGGEETRIITLLGSCISVTAWHPALHVGGMCHYLLPSRGGSRKAGALDGHYADEALQLLLREIAEHHTRPQEYQVKIFGGGNMFPFHEPKNAATNSGDIGSRNTEAARRLLEKHGFQRPAEHVGGGGHRKLIFQLWDGEVWVRHVRECAEQVKIKIRPLQA